MALLKEALLWINLSEFSLLKSGKLEKKSFLRRSIRFLMSKLRPENLKIVIRSQELGWLKSLHKFMIKVYKSPII